MKQFLIVALIVCWVYLIHILSKSKLYFWKFLTGSVGSFIIMMILARPVLTMPLARAVAAGAGVFGDFTGTFTAYFKYGILFVSSLTGDVTLQIDFECSGIIEIMAYLSLLFFYRVYNWKEKIITGVLGVIGIIFANVLRIVVICEMIHFMGVDAYHVAHTIVGRLVFYMASVMLYFYIFTKPQIVRMKVGKFTYGNAK